jgi:hypothetical protein
VPNFSRQHLTQQICLTVHAHSLSKQLDWGKKLKSRRKYKLK